MKRLIIIIFALFSFTAATYAQVRHVQGINLIGISSGIVPGSNGSTHIVGLNYSKYLRKNWIVNFSGLYDSGTIQSTKVNIYLFNGGVDFTALQYGAFLYCNFGLSVLAGLETLGVSETSENRNSFVSGPSGNINIEMYLTDRIIMQLKAEQNYLTGTNLSNWYSAFHVGLKYCIY